MNLFEEIKQRAAKYPDLGIEEKGRALVLKPASEGGFPIEISLESDEITVVFGEAFHWHFDEPSEALELVAFGLSSSCRLLVEKKGSRPFRTVVQRLESGSWRPVATTGLLLYPFWKRTTREIRRNDVVK